MKKFISLCLMFLIISFSILPAYASTSPIELYSQYAYLYDRHTKKVYIHQESDEKMFPASITKIFTVSMALKKIGNIHEKVKIESVDFDGLFQAGASMAGFQPDETVTYEDLLYGAMLPSGADACNALARLTYGSVQGMVNAMNEYLKELKIDSTHFTNVTGLHDDNHYTTAHDMALILDDALNNPVFKTVFETRTYQDSKKRRTWTSALQRAGQMMQKDTSQINGGKSGYTDKAQLTFASSMTIDGHELILVTANAKGQRSHKHVLDVLHVYEYMKDNYKNVNILKKGEEIGDFVFLTSYPLSYKLEVNQDLNLLLPHSLNEKEITLQKEKDFIHLFPVEKGKNIMKITVKYHDLNLYELNVPMQENIPISIYVCLVYFVVIVTIIFFIIKIIISTMNKRITK